MLTSLHVSDGWVHPSIYYLLLYWFSICFMIFMDSNSSFYHQWMTPFLIHMARASISTPLILIRMILPLYSALPPWPLNSTCRKCWERRMLITMKRPTSINGRLDCDLQRYSTMSWYAVVSVYECPSTTALELVTQSHSVSDRLSNSTSTHVSKNSTSYGAGKLLTRWWGNSWIAGLCGIWQSFKNLCLWQPGYGSGMYTMMQRVQMPE